jgi:hypothetical protein
MSTSVLMVITPTITCPGNRQRRPAAPWCRLRALPSKTPRIPCGFSSVMVVDNWSGIVRAVPARSRDSRHQFRLLPAVECSTSKPKPWIEAADLDKSGPPVGDVCTLNNTGLNKTARRKRKRLQRFLYGYSEVRWIMQQNPPTHKTKFWIIGEALEY